jgi:thiamine pyrophosphokinase
MKQTRCVIVTGGDFGPVPELRSDDFVIACDRGYCHCERLGIRPDLVISDFDSYRGPIAPELPLNTYASEKDDTDTMLAIRYAAEHGFREVLLCCALGGRLDHLIANLQSLVFAQKHGLSARLFDEDTEVCTLQGSSMRLPRRPGWSLSVFAADGPCGGVSISGAKYPLRDAELLPSFPLGVSNAWAADEALVSVREGILLIVLSRIPE